MNAYSLVLIVCGLVQDSGAAPLLQSKRQTQDVTQVPIELIETDSRKVAFIEHSGPYWSLGPVIDQVARDARAMGVRDALVIRYLDDPVSASPAGLRTEVGFELVGSDLPKPPYKFAEWSPALVARKTVSGPDGLSTRHFASLKAWAQTQSLVPAGDSIAVLQMDEGGASAAIKRAEILLPVCVPDAPPENPAPSRQESVDKPALSESFGSAQSSPGKRMVTKVIQLPAPKEVTDEESPRVALGTPVKDAPRTQLAAPFDEARTTTPPAPVRSSIPIREWIEEGKFAEVASTLLPEKGDPASQQWADQMAARIVALANGVQKLSPEREGWLADFAAQLAARRDALRADSPKGTPRIIGPSGSAGSKEADRKALMRELDRLMANVSYRSLSPDQIRENLIELLVKVPPLASP